MSKDCCMDCGMLLSPHTSICSVCGFDNKYDNKSDGELEIDKVAEVRQDIVRIKRSGLQLEGYLARSL